MTGVNGKQVSIKQGLRNSPCADPPSVVCRRSAVKALSQSRSGLRGYRPSQRVRVFARNKTLQIGDRFKAGDLNALTVLGQRALLKWRSPTTSAAARSVNNGTPSSLSTPDRQSLLTIEPLDLLAVDRDAIPAEQDVQPHIAEPSALPHQFTKPRPQVAIIRRHERYPMLVGSAPAGVTIF
jgi:hypothetical protein